MDVKRIFPIFLLAALGFILAAWNVYIIAVNLGTVPLQNLKSPIVFIVTGLLLIGFSVYYAKNGDQYSERPEEEIQIIWEEDPEEKE